jgi:hypothetical protein
MNKTWYDCSVKYRKTTENGTQKVVTESYLVDAISFTEAESRINEEIKAYISEEFRVTNIKVTNYSEVHSSDDSFHWFKSKISLLAYDEESGKERKTNIYLLVEANDAKDAYDKTIVAMKNTMGEYSIPAVSETKIINVFPYFSKETE